MKIFSEKNKIALEIAVIVGSVLFAFLIEAWWSERNDSEQEYALLSALREDLEISKEALEVTWENHERILEASRIVLDYGEIGQLEESQHVDFGNAVGRHFQRARYLPPTGTITSIINSGRLDLISNPQLVPALNQWVAQLETVSRFEIALENHFYERIYPYLASRVDLEDLDKGFANYVEIPWDQGETDAYLLVTDTEFLSMIYMHWVLSNNCLTYLEDAKEQLQKIIELF